MIDIPITKPYFGPEEFELIRKPLESGWVVQGPYVRQFEEMFAEFVGAPYAVATSSCTTALHIAIAALEVQPGDEVIVPAFTWVATANVVEYIGAKPVFVDIDLATFNINVNCIEEAFTPRTVGIIPVHLFGLHADMEPILNLARKHHLWVLEDAACAFGAYYHGVHAGLFGNVGCFSFHPRKAITTGEGGMFITREESLARTARALRDHGAVTSDLERHREGVMGLPEFPYLGYNYRMTDIQGALGVAQMRRATWLLEERRRIAKRYYEAFDQVPWLRCPVEPEGFVHSYQAFVCLFAPEEPSLENVETLFLQRQALAHFLAKRGIATRPGTHAPPLLEYYRDKYGYRPEDFPNAYIAEKLSLALPLFAGMTESQQEQVIQAVLDFQVG